MAPHNKTCRLRRANCDLIVMKLSPSINLQPHYQLFRALAAMLVPAPLDFSAAAVHIPIPVEYTPRLGNNAKSVSGAAERITNDAGPALPAVSSSSGCQRWPPSVDTKTLPPCDANASRCRVG